MTADVRHDLLHAGATIPRPHGRPRFGTSLLGAGVLLLAAVAAVLGVRYQRAHASPPVQFETSTVDRGSISAKVVATGSVSALLTVSVGSQVSGRIDTLLVDFESPVKKGQIIATIEPSLFNAAVAQARANFDASVANVDQARAKRVQAERDFTIAQSLRAQGLMSRQDFDAAEANLGVAIGALGSAVATVEQNRAALGQAQLNRTYCTIRSPIDGVVISRNIDVGQTVAASFQAPTLFTIAEDLTKMQVDTNVSEADVGKIRAGMPATFSVDAYPDRTFSGVVRQIRNNAQTIQNVVTYDAVIDVENHDLLLRPSMTANVTFVYATRESSLRIPNAALRFKPDVAAQAVLRREHAPLLRDLTHALKPDEHIVWALREGHPIPERVRTGITDGETTEVEAGKLHEGDKLVTEVNILAGGARS